MEQTALPAGQCPTCGASYQPGATICVYCGSPLIPAQAPGGGSPALGSLSQTQQPSTAAAQADPAAESALAAPQAEGGPRKRCSWCGAQNPADAQTCEGCGAAFPRPEQDEALLRASEERIRVANDSISTLRKERERKGFGRFFGR